MRCNSKGVTVASPGGVVHLGVSAKEKGLRTPCYSVGKF